MDNSVFFYIAAAAENFARAAQEAPKIFGVEEMRGILSAAFNAHGAAFDEATKESMRADIEGRCADEKIQRAAVVASAALDFVRARFSSVEVLQE